MVDTIIGGKYRLGRKIGSGSFGEVHIGTNTVTGEEVAVKLEPIRSRAPQLLYEAKVYRVLQGGVGVPAVHWYGIEGDYNIMVVDLLGPSLEDLFNMCSRRFSLKTTLMLADQMISRLEHMHAKNIIHRDIKPDNFLVGTGSKVHKVHIIDFGLAKKYRDSKTFQHIAYRDNKALTGTARYASVNTHLGVEQSRRDDLEAIGYVLVYFLRGSLPWQGLQARSKRDKYEQIMRKKVDTSPETLCQSLPQEFSTYLSYCRGLRFEDRPDYAYLRKLLSDLLAREGYSVDYVFDWSRQLSKEPRGQHQQVSEQRQQHADARAHPDPQQAPTSQAQVCTHKAEQPSRTPKESLSRPTQSPTTQKEVSMMATPQGTVRTNRFFTEQRAGTQSQHQGQQQPQQAVTPQTPVHRECALDEACVMLSRLRGGLQKLSLQPHSRQPLTPQNSPPTLSAQLHSQSQTPHQTPHGSPQASPQGSPQGSPHPAAAAMRQQPNQHVGFHIQRPLQCPSPMERKLTAAAHFK